MSAASGRYVWFDLMTPDRNGAKSFYTDVVGWKTSSWEQGDYEMWAMGDKQIGGVMDLPKDAGAPPHWIGYVAVDSVDATTEKAKKLGGKVYHQPTDIPNVGRFAVLADPQGAAFAVFQGSGTPMMPEQQAPGRVGWSELATTDWESAWKFYSELFGWKSTSKMDMGPEMGTYAMFGTDEKNTMGGMGNMAVMMKAPPHWLHYFNVPSAEQAVKKIQAKGGKVLNGPMEVPGGGWIVQAMDPQGAAFAIFAPAK